MQILFDDETATFDLLDSDLAPVYRQIMSRLRHIDIPFRAWDNPYTVGDPVPRLIRYGSKVGVTIDQDKCVSKDQDYLNFLHTIYEQKYDGHPEWLDYHENIHLCEADTVPRGYLTIDFREKAGLLEKPFDLNWLQKSTTVIKAGDVFVQWAELGKSPYAYWCDKEPDDIDRIKQLCKPWLKLRPQILVALQDIDYSLISDEFHRWWQQYHAQWCHHWKIPKWDQTDMRSRMVFGQMCSAELDKLTQLLQHKKTPRRILP